MLVSSSVEILREALEFSIMMWLKVSVREIWIFLKLIFTEFLKMHTHISVADL